MKDGSFLRMLIDIFHTTPLEYSDIIYRDGNVIYVCFKNIDYPSIENG